LPETAVIITKHRQPVSLVGQLQTIPLHGAIEKQRSLKRDEDINVHLIRQMVQRLSLDEKIYEMEKIWKYVIMI
jgi:hypothetical protein